MKIAQKLSAMKLSALIAAVTAVSFGTTLHFMGIDLSSSDSKRIAQQFATRENLRSGLAALSACMKTSVAQQCQAYGNKLAATLEQTPSAAYTFFRQDKYSVAIFENYAVAFKTNCKNEDLDVDEFLLNIWLNDKSKLPEHLRADGAVKSQHYFSKAGIKSGSTCFIAVPLDYGDLAYIEMGQFDHVNNQWIWRAHDKL